MFYLVDRVKVLFYQEKENGGGRGEGGIAERERGKGEKDVKKDFG